MEDTRECVRAEIDDLIAFGFSNLKTTDVLNHKIDVQDGCAPIKQKVRRIPHYFRDEFQKTITEMKYQGLIRESRSPWCSPVRLVQKKDKSLRVTVDYTKLNNVTIKVSYPIPRINEMFDRLSSGSVFSTLDLASGYYQVAMDENSKKYTAFA